MGVMVASRARFPDPLVGFTPALANSVPEAGQQTLRFAIETSAPASELRHSIDDFAVDVELKLLVSVVPDTHRSGIGVPREMRQLSLWKVRLTKHIVQDLKLGPGGPRRVQHPVQEGRGLLGIPEDEEGAQRERRV